MYTLFGEDEKCANAGANHSKTSACEIPQVKKFHDLLKTDSRPSVI